MENIIGRAIKTYLGVDWGCWGLGGLLCLPQDNESSESNVPKYRVFKVSRFETVAMVLDRYFVVGHARPLEKVFAWTMYVTQ